MLRSRYLERLGLLDQEEKFATTLSKQNLDLLIETHLKTLTFDNLSQHGLPYPTVLNVEALAEKLLEQKRGGFCYEMNGLFAELLVDLGYHVKRVPAIVNSPVVGFRHEPTHCMLVVGIPSDDNADASSLEPVTEYVVDVGFGEPAIHSLRYKLNLERETPEGMVSRLVKGEEDPSMVVLQWKRDGDWAPRLLWEWKHPGQALSDFQPSLNITLGDSSIFSQKLIVCRITRDEKVTLAGTRLKRTSPRFGPDSVTTVELLESLEQVKQVLRDTFQVPDTEGLDLTRSMQAAPEVWTEV